MSSLEEFTEKYYPLVRGRVSSLLRESPQVCEDVTQEIFLGFVKGYREGKFKTEKSLSTILYVITDRRCIDFVRGRSKSREVLRRVEEEAVPMIQESDDGGLERRELLKLAEGCLGALRPIHKRVAELYVFLDLSDEEIAEHLGITVRQVRGYFDEALRAIQKSIHRYDRRVERRSFPTYGELELCFWLDRLATAYLLLGHRKGRLSPVLSAEVQQVLRCIRDAITKRNPAPSKDTKAGTTEGVGFQRPLLYRES